ncbi:uncharacterized protein EI97DRAFT_443088 [Westerdykella ornata]|uniref:RING-type domain-containing protein n=1 Tax=Westerdykella ornata TaxID=318751 RepID=A0A6A6JI80_WESOR|nr:uncharacterized protein EI97DRAFT_443088 [Westerdykella ornata]KAF2275658.1 hypothetical protein EI97DRAFT_443088 [Westerdykella ornata]
MGQASSRGRPDPSPPNRDRARPTSWAPRLSPPTPAGDDAAQEGRPTTPRPQRPVSQRLYPFNALSAYRRRSDAGPSETDEPPSVPNPPSRISRARSSLTHIPQIFHRRRNLSSLHPSSLSRPFRSSSRTNLRPGTPTTQDSGLYLPNLQAPTLDTDLDDPSEPQSGDVLDSLLPPRPNRTRSLASSIRPTFRHDRGVRSITSSLRRRRSPPSSTDEDQADMLSRLLSIAATATAASLVGDDHRAVAEARNVAGDGEDATFDSFLQALENGRIASVLRQAGNNAEAADVEATGDPTPVNFFRMFRFGSPRPNRRDTSSNDRDSAMGSPEEESRDEEGDDRMVPIIIVGIRSINPNAPTPDDVIPGFLDVLSNFPAPLSEPGTSSTDGIPRQPQQRFSHRRRASMGGLNNFPSNYDSQRHHRMPERPRPLSTFNDGPSGSMPPPSTPASVGLSRISSGTNTPTASTSPPSPTVQSAVPSRRGSFIRRTLEPTDEHPETQPTVPRQRRMSESDFTRFGSGAARRNGFVEPDSRFNGWASRRNGVAEPDNRPWDARARSWIIYVLGGSYPENHPILTTPSLFTDSPTYEDMLLLSSLLGSAKPPVASEEDVAAAPGRFTIRGVAPDGVVAEGIESKEIISLASARCLVCLCDYEVNEEARRLVNCGHLFHRVCIDQWLTTGRNSCPLCRGQGVDEKTGRPQSIGTPIPPSSTQHIS